MADGVLQRVVANVGSVRTRREVLLRLRLFVIDATVQESMPMHVVELLTQHRYSRIRHCLTSRHAHHLFLRWEGACITSSTGELVHHILSYEGTRCCIVERTHVPWCR